jgi:hypothetical protein
MSGGGAVRAATPAASQTRFRRHHPGTALRGMVIGINQSWCRGDGQIELTNPFPFWLYADSALDDELLARAGAGDGELHDAAAGGGDALGFQELHHRIADDGGVDRRLPPEACDGEALAEHRHPMLAEQREAPGVVGIERQEQHRRHGAQRQRAGGVEREQAPPALRSGNR